MTDEHDPGESDAPAEDISDELAKKYDPERLLKIMAKRAGRGESLDHSIRNKYEQKFGVDLGHVRIVTGEFAEEYNKRNNSYAVTIGSTGMILMGNSPDRSMTSAAGEALLAHELTHVAQAQRSHDKQHMPFGVAAAGVGGAGQATHEQEAAHVEHETLQGAGTASMESKGEAEAHAKQAAGELEKIKARVLDLFADAVRTHRTRSG